MNGEAFLRYIQEVLGPTLQPGDIVVADNLSSHKPKKRGEFDRIVWCGLGGVGFVHSTTVHQPSRIKRSTSKSVFGIKQAAIFQTALKKIPVTQSALDIGGGGRSSFLRLPGREVFSASVSIFTPSSSSNMPRDTARRTAFFR